MPEVQRIDVRGPRFAASITAVLLLVATFLSLIGVATGDLAAAPLSARILDPGFLLLLVIALLFVWGVASPRTAPWGVLYRRVVQPRLASTADVPTVVGLTIEQARELAPYNSATSLQVAALTSRQLSSLDQADLNALTTAQYEIGRAHV